MFSIFKIFSPYVHPFEKKTDKFLRSLNSKSNKTKTQKKLLELMQENLAMLTLWMEKRSKNYKRLSKRYRRLRYENLEVIEAMFQGYELKQNFPETVFNKFRVSFDEEKKNKTKYLWKIMQFCQEYFDYQESSSFDKLLFNPTKTRKMIGDCNQITTFYAHLYALKYPITDLEIRLFDGHVALHFQGIDIEATKGTFVKHKKEGQVLSILEIVSTNLLDVADFREKQRNINPQAFFKTAQLAFLLSSLTKTVQHNLDVALQKLAINFSKEEKFGEAFLFYSKIINPKIKIQTSATFKRAVSYYVKKGNFKKAKHYAKKVQDKKTDKFILHHEVVYYLKKKNFTKARKLALALKNAELIRNIAQNEYAYLAKSLKKIKTISEAKWKKSVYKKLLKLAKESKEVELEKYPRGVLRQIEKNQ